MANKPMDITGQGGGKGGKGGGGSSIAKDTINVSSKVKLLYAISEGPISGLVNGKQGIYLSKTPLQNEAGEDNIEGVKFQEHLGLPDDEPFKGHDAVGTLVPVGQDVTNEAGPVIRTISEPEVTRVRVVIRVNSLFKAKDGDIEKNNLEYNIDVRPAGGTYTNAVNFLLKKEKTSSPAQFIHDVELPAGGAPWDIRVTRISEAPKNESHQNSFAWESMILLEDGLFTYPHTAAVALEIPAEAVSGSAGDILFKVRGREIEVPSNYDPETRTYTGFWDGTFKTAFCKNPAWIFWDMATHDIYGLGDLIDKTIINKWSLYSIAQYCDGMVPSGYKDEQGQDILEPRYEFNGEYRNRTEAYNVLQQITQTWRGMGFWSLGQMFATADMPSDPVALVTPANVIDGAFNYSSTATKARHSVALVGWNDPNDFYRDAVEVVINKDLIKRYGWREKQVKLKGCSSRALARRHGNWILDVEQHETETVSYQASMDHINCLPGQIISISDPRKMQVSAGGRVFSHTQTSMILDRVFEPEDGQSYSIIWTTPNLELEERPIVSFEDETLTLGGDPIDPERLAATGAVFSISGTSIQPRQFRVLTVNEVEPHIFAVTALEHDPNKYARIERGIKFDDVPVSQGPKFVSPPSNLSLIEQTQVKSGGVTGKVMLSWSPPGGTPVTGYNIQVEGPDGVKTLPRTQETSVDISIEKEGDYIFYVQSIDYAGRVSPFASLSYSAAFALSLPEATVSSVTLKEGGTTFNGSDVSINWSNAFPQTAMQNQTVSGLTEAFSPLYKRNILKIYRTSDNALLRTVYVSGDSYVYTIAQNTADGAALNSAPTRSLRFDVSVEDIYGRESEAQSLSVSNGVPAAVNPTVEVEGNLVSISWPAVADNDLVGYKLWIQKDDSLFDPYQTAPVFNGQGGQYSFFGEQNSTYYLKIAAYDAFGDTGLNISAPIEIQTAFAFIKDKNPPSVPTGLAVSSVATGDGTADVTATWDVSSDADFAHFEVAYKTNSGSWSSITTSEPRFVLSAKSGVTYLFKVRAIDRLGNASTYSAEVSHVAVSDTIAPDQIQNLVASAGINSIFLSWDVSAVSDFKVYEIYEASAATPAPTAATTATLTSVTNFFQRSGLDGGDQRYYWVRAVDISGNKGAWSAIASETALASSNSQVTTEALQGLVDATSFASSISPIEVLSALPGEPHVANRQVLLTTDGKLYRNTGSGWVTGVDASDVSGSLTGSQIAAESITPEKLVVKSSTKASNSDPYMEDAVWLNKSGYSHEIISDAPFGNGKVLRAVGHAPARWYESEYPAYAIHEDRTYRLRIVAKAHIDGTNFYGAWAFKDASGALVKTATDGWPGVNLSIGSYYFPSNALMPVGEWVVYENTIGPKGNMQIPAGARELLLGVIANYQGDSSEITDFAEISFTEMTDANLIVDGAITADKLYIGTASANLVVNPSAASGTTVGWDYAHGTDTGMGIANEGPNGDPCWAIGENAGATGEGCYAFPVVPGRTYSIRFAKKGSVATSTGCYARIHYTAAQPSTKVISTANFDAHADLYANGPVSTDWEIVERTWTAPANARWATLAFYRWAGMSGSVLYLDDIDMREVVEGVLIKDGAVTAGKIAAGAIGADKIEANSIGAGQIAAGAIGADQIAAKAISTDKLLVGGTNLVANPNFSTGDFTGWVPNAGASLFSVVPYDAADVPAQAAGPFVCQIEATGQTATMFSGEVANTSAGAYEHMYPVVPGETIRLALRAAISPGTTIGSFRIYMWEYDANKNRVASHYRVFDGELTESWKDFVAEIPVPNNITAVGLYIYTTQLNGKLFISEASAHKMNAANLIVTGGIQANHLSAESVTTDKLAANAVTANEIQAGAVSTDKLAANAVNADKIAANAITAAKIAGGTITGDKIASNTISANKLEIGARGFNLTGVVFEADADANTLTWTAGTLHYINNAGVPTAASINAGSTTWTAGTVYVTWINGAVAFSATTDLSTAMDANRAIIATYKGGALVDVDAGMTVIDGSTIKTGTITADRLAAGAILAENIVGQTMSTEHLSVDTNLVINAATGGFSIGKTSAYDVDNNGAYFGRTQGDEGGVGFGFIAGQKNAAGYDELIQATTQTGLQITNAQFYQNRASADPSTTTTTSQTITLNSLHNLLNFTLVGGGGGGAGGGEFGDARETDGTNKGGNGGVSTVVLKDGNTTIATWTAAGGVGGQGYQSSPEGDFGETSPDGQGGAGGLPGARDYFSNSVLWSPQPGGSPAATSYGAGGGGGGAFKDGGLGGGVSDRVLIVDYDISGLTDPKLVLTVGTGGSGGQAGPEGAVGGAGASGKLTYQTRLDQRLRADVLTLTPTNVGTMSSHGPFPDLGAGFWIITPSTNTVLNLAQFEINDTGETLQAARTDFVAFVSSKTPVVTLTNQTLRTLKYQFYKMGD